MKEVQVQNLKPGMRLGGPLIKANIKLLDAGIALTSSQIEKIARYWPDHYISILEEDDELPLLNRNNIGKTKKKLKTENTPNLLNCQTRGFLYPDLANDESGQEELLIIRDYLIDAIKQSLNTAHIRRVVENCNINFLNNILDEVAHVKDVLINTGNLLHYDQALFQHSVNVSVLACALAYQLGENEERSRSITAGALLHDIGKTQENNENENSQPDHCTQGFEILRAFRNIGPVTSHIAFQHHEDYNGNGFPRQIADKNILYFARIVRVVNDYDLMSSSMVSNQSVNYAVLNALISSMSIIYDPEIVNILIKTLQAVSVGSVVQLNTGDVALVIEKNDDYPLKTTVKCFINSQGETIRSFPTIDLARETSIKIIKLLE